MNFSYVTLPLGDTAICCYVVTCMGTESTVILHGG